MKLAERVRCASPQHIIPLHEVRDPELHQAVRRSMEIDGWRGRPLVVMRIGEDLRALTGSHRLQAALDADLETIPVIELTPREAASAMSAPSWVKFGGPVNPEDLGIQLKYDGFQIGGLILIDNLHRHSPLDPWDKRFISSIRALKSIGSQVLDVLKVERWNCS